jgi:hypothetical protein
MSDFEITGLLSEFAGAFHIDPATERLLSGSHNVAGSWSTVQVSGLAELERNLNELPDAIAKKVLRQAVGFASDLFIQRARGLAPFGPNDRMGGRGRQWKTMHLRDAILKQVSVRFQGVRGATIRGKVGLDKQHAFYGRFLEKGWTGVHGERHEPRHWMLQAFEEMKRPALGVFEVMLREGIQREAARLHSQA